MPVPDGAWHWQIVKHRADGSAREGGFRTFDIEHSAAALIDIAVVLRRPIGEGFYGVDVKERQRLHRDGGQGQSNLEHGIEDQTAKTKSG